MSFRVIGARKLGAWKVQRFAPFLIINLHMQPSPNHIPKYAIFPYLKPNNSDGIRYILIFTPYRFTTHFFFAFDMLYSLWRVVEFWFFFLAFAIKKNVLNN